MGQGEQVHSLLLPPSLLPAASFPARTSWSFMGFQRRTGRPGLTTADYTLSARFSGNACSPTGAMRETRTQSQGDTVNYYRSWQQFPIPYRTPKLPFILLSVPMTKAIHTSQLTPKLVPTMLHPRAGDQVSQCYQFQTLGSKPSKQGLPFKIRSEQQLDTCVLTLLA